jgi:hypothetical protein
MSEERDKNDSARCLICFELKSKCNCEISELDLEILEEEEIERRINKRDAAPKYKKMKLKRGDRRTYE